MQREQLVEQGVAGHGGLAALVLQPLPLVEVQGSASDLRARCPKMQASHISGVTCDKGTLNKVRGCFGMIENKA